MAIWQRPRYGEVQWGWLFWALSLAAIGVVFVISATLQAGGDVRVGSEGIRQILWLGISLTACLMVLHVRTRLWQGAAFPIYMLTIMLQFVMLALAGTSLVPTIKGAHNWIALGPARLQPSEFFKLGALLGCARLLSLPGIHAERFTVVVAVLAMAGLPALLLAKEDLGSALTFLPMALGMLLLAGMRLRHLTVVVGGLSAVVLTGVAMLPREGPKSYQWRRIQAWLNPEDYALTEAFQVNRSLRSIGSGQWTGKGYAQGDQNLLGWLPEKHTDMIFAVIGEEVGFLGSVAVLVCYLFFGWAGLYAAANTRDRFAASLIAGFTCLVIGQAAINIAVVLGLMPVTGITLPFISYGGSSLLALFIGLGMCLAASSNTRIGQFDQLQRWQ